jgi:hypothetical protein
LVTLTFEKPNFFLKMVAIKLRIHSFCYNFLILQGMSFPQGSYAF